MKLSNCKIYVAAALAAAMALGANAGDEPKASPALSVLSTATAAELPAKASDLVAKADAKTLKQTTIDVVKVAVGLNPAAAPAVVGSIAQRTAPMAPTAAATAVALVPNQVLLIAKAAAAAAPTKAGAIVEAICRVLPADYQIVASAVADVVPGSGREILAGVAAALPQLKDAINQALASYQGSIPSVSTVLAQVAQSESAAAIASAGTPASASSSAGTTPVVRGPTVGPPPTPPAGTPTTVDPGTGGVIPNGEGRGYAAP